MWSFYSNAVTQYITDDSVNANVFLTYANDAPGTVGIAWLGSVCGAKSERVSINEYFVSDASTGHIVAHEIGHNLGMNHDFVGSDPNQVWNDINIFKEFQKWYTFTWTFWNHLQSLFSHYATYYNVFIQ